MTHSLVWTRPDKPKAWAVDLNWYLNRAIKTQVDYESTTFEGGSPRGDREDEKVLFTRAQVAF